MLRALQVARQGWGESDPHVAAALNNLAEVYQLAGKTAEAEALYLDVRFPAWRGVAHRLAILVVISSSVLALPEVLANKA